MLSSVIVFISSRALSFRHPTLPKRRDDRPYHDSPRLRELAERAARRSRSVKFHHADGRYRGSPGPMTSDKFRNWQSLDVMANSRRGDFYARFLRFLRSTIFRDIRNHPSAKTPATEKGFFFAKKITCCRCGAAVVPCSPRMKKAPSN
jgi:hypothetical protein